MTEPIKGDALAVVAEFYAPPGALGVAESLAADAGAELPGELSDAAILYDTAFRAAAESDPALTGEALQVVKLAAELLHTRRELDELRWQRFLWGLGPLPEG